MEISFFSEIILILSSLPYTIIFISSVITFIIGLLWSGYIFKHKYIRLTGHPLIQNKTVLTFILLYIQHFLLSYFIAILILSFNPSLLLLTIDSFLAFIIFTMLAEKVMRKPITNDGFRLWLLQSLYFIVIVLIALNVFILLKAF